MDDVTMPPYDQRADDDDTVQYVVGELRKAMRDEKGVAATIKNLGEARKLLDTVVPPLVREVARVYPAIHTLLEAAEGHLGELHGPVVDMHRCDKCGNCVPDVYLDRELNSYVECENNADGEEPHGPMRHVRCRVTADDPERAA